MKPEYELYQQIDNYLTNQLSADERNLFEQNLASDPALKSQVELQQITNDLIIENRFNVVFDKVINETPSKPGFNKSLLLSMVGAGILAAVLLTYFSGNKNEEKVIVNEEKTEKQIDSQSSIKSQTKSLENNNNKSKDLIWKEVILCEIRNEDKYDFTKVDSILNASIKIDSFSSTAISNPLIINSSEKSTIIQLVEKSKSENISTHENKPSVIQPEKTVEKINYSFNPQMGEVWKYSPTLPYKYKVIVYNKSGNKVFEYTADVNQELIWDGQSNLGENISSGLYLVQIQYENNTTVHGEISIIQ